jgi:hypothetical protein
MGKPVTVKKHFTFVAGLNTVAGPLTFPPNAWADGDNVVPGVDGSLSLRKAIDYEGSYSLSTTSKTNAEAAAGAYGCYEWNSVAGNGNHNLLVVQQGTTVSFYTNNGNNISANAKAFTVNLATYKVTGNPEVDGVAPIDCASVNGALIIVSRDTTPIIVTYDTSDDTIDVAELTIQIRDFIGVDDGLAINTRPATLSDAHNYNLLNQGWTAAHIATYFTANAVYPSSAQSWTAGKDSSDNFSAALLDKQDFGTSPAPKGRFVLDLFTRNRTSVSGVPNITTETEYYRPTTCAFMAGRSWFAGMRSSTIANWVVFSQVAETNDNLGRCYQSADPTSEVISDLVKSDGGVIPIQDAGAIIKLVPFGNSMLVLADNGVWQIVGGSESGFSADSYEVRRLASIGCVSPRTVVRAESNVLFWGDTAIYSIAANELGSAVVQPITMTNIANMYDDIPTPGKLYASGTYDPLNKVVYWFYNDDEDADGTSWRFRKNRMLCLDGRLNAFYTFTIGELAEHSPYVVDAFVTKARSFIAEPITVVVGADTVVVGADTVVVTGTPSGSYAISPPYLKFLALHNVDDSSFKVTMANFDETNDAPRKWRDWYSRNTAGINYSGYVVPGYDFGEGLGGDKYFQALYVMVYMRRTETGVDADGDPINPSSCTMQGRWDWTDSSSSNKWTSSQQVYRHTRVFNVATPSATFDDGHPVVVTKNKVRGRGRALQLKFTSENDYDMQLLGWAVTYIGNANV